MTLEATERRPGSAWRTLIILLIAFLAGLAVMAWLLTRWDEGARLLGLRAQPVLAAQAPAARLPQPVPTPPAPGDVPGQLRYLESRLAQVEGATRAAAGNSERADRLLVAAAARRALERGVSLGYLEGLLRQRFGDAQPAAVATVIAASRQPVTLTQLQLDLRELQTQLETPPPEVGLLDRLKTEFGSLITIRKEGTPSTVPTERYDRANAALGAGQVDVALAEVLRMPGQARARDWIERARRYVAARRALDAVETAALLDGPA